MIEMVAGQHGYAAGIVLFAALTRVKLLLLDRLNPRVPDWIAFVISSAVLWMILALAT